MLGHILSAMCVLESMVARHQGLSLGYLRMPPKPSPQFIVRISRSTRVPGREMIRDLTNMHDWIHVDELHMVQYDVLMFVTADTNARKLKDAIGQVLDPTTEIVYVCKVVRG